MIDAKSLPAKAKASRTYLSFCILELHPEGIKFLVLHRLQIGPSRCVNQAVASQYTYQSTLYSETRSSPTFFRHFHVIVNAFANELTLSTTFLRNKKVNLVKYKPMK